MPLGNEWTPEHEYVGQSRLSGQTPADVYDENADLIAPSQRPIPVDGDYDEAASLITEMPVPVDGDYDENADLIAPSQRPIPSDGDYDEFASLIPKMPIQWMAYDEETSLIPDVENVRTEYNNTPNLIDTIGNRIHDTAEAVYNTGIAMLQAEALLTLNMITRFEVGTLGLTKPTINLKQSWGDIKSGNVFNVRGIITQTTAHINRIINAEGAKAIGPLEELPANQYEGLTSAANTIRYTYKEADLAAFGREAISMMPPKLPPNTLNPTVFANRYAPGSDTEYSLAKVIGSIPNKGVFTFKIQNLARDPGNDIEWFPAYIEDFNESVSADWGEISFINRSEDMYVYQRASRDFNLEFVLFAEQYKRERTANATLTGDGDGSRFKFYMNNKTSTLEAITKEDLWRKINFLHSLMRPKYDKGRYAASPFARLWLGNLYTGIYAKIDELTINPSDPLLWDLEDENIRPMIMKITLSGKFLHKKVPSASHEYDYYTDFTRGEK